MAHEGARKALREHPHGRTETGRGRRGRRIGGRTWQDEGVDVVMLKTAVLTSTGPLLVDQEVHVATLILTRGVGVISFLLMLSAAG